MNSNKSTYQKLSLIPSDLLEKLRHQNPNVNLFDGSDNLNKNLDFPNNVDFLKTNNNNKNTQINTKMSNERILSQFPKLIAEDANRIVENLPQGAMRTRGLVLLQHLIGKVHLNEQQQIIYPDSLEVGSHLADLVIFAVQLPGLGILADKSLSPRTATNTTTAFKMQQPVDIWQFSRLARSLNVPSYSIPNLIAYRKRLRKSGVGEDGNKLSSLSADNTLPLSPSTSMHENLSGLKNKLVKNNNQTGPLTSTSKFGDKPSSRQPVLNETVYSHGADKKHYRHSINKTNSKKSQQLAMSVVGNGHIRNKSSRSPYFNNNKSRKLPLLSPSSSTRPYHWLP
jgi:hypothetical protein